MSLPSFDVGLPAYYVIATSEASSNLSRYDGVRYGLRQQVTFLYLSLPLAKPMCCMFVAQQKLAVCCSTLGCRWAFGMARLQEGNIREMYNETRGEGLNGEVKRRILMGTYALSAGYYDAYYKRAQQARPCSHELHG